MPAAFNFVEGFAVEWLMPFLSLMLFQIASAS